MHLKYSLLTIVLTALLSQASGERGKWITASEALERSAKAEAVPEEGCGKWVDPQMERFSATIENKLKPTGYKLPRSLEFTVDMGLGDSELPPLCMDAFKTELNDLGFRITETRGSGNRMRPHWVGFTIEWGEKEEHLKEDNNHDRCEKEASDLGDLQDTKDILASLMKTAGLGDIKESNRIADDMLKEIDRIVDNTMKEIDRIVDNMMKEIKQYDGVKSDFQKFDAEFDEVIKSLLDDEALDDDDE